MLSRLETPTLAELKDGPACFICLETASGTEELLRCCTQCNSFTHEACWDSWRQQQRLAGLRASLLATNVADPLSCSICKTGLAFTENEGPPETLSWARQDSEQRRLQDQLLNVMGRMLQARRRDSDEAIAMPTSICRQLAMAYAILTVGVIGGNAVEFIWNPPTYWGLLILPTLAFLYFAGAAFMLIAIRKQRQHVLGPLRRRSSRPDPESSLNVPVSIERGSNISIEGWRPDAIDNNDTFCIFIHGQFPKRLPSNRWGALNVKRCLNTSP